ncbi:hypothetical protein [Tenacibaculum halocynthiae]|uniref:hypothetical protein n=1 Tax=Tenacibaculum halocynthiae TaxID=1254437 RepID=UPI003D65DD75
MEKLTSVPGTMMTYAKTEQGPEINFAISTKNIDTRPLPPVIFATYNDKNQVVVSATVFVPKCLVSEKEVVKFQINEFRANTNELYFYIAYKAHPVYSNEFYAYNVNFNTTEQFNSDEISKIKVILWDKDPEGSRGTETTVKQPA